MRFLHAFGIQFYPFGHSSIVRTRRKMRGFYCSGRKVGTNPHPSRSAANLRLLETCNFWTQVESEKANKV